MTRKKEAYRGKRRFSARVQLLAEAQAEGLLPSDDASQRQTVSLVYQLERSAIRWRRAPKGSAKRKAERWHVQRKAEEVLERLDESHPDIFKRYPTSGWPVPSWLSRAVIHLGGVALSSGTLTRRVKPAPLWAPGARATDWRCKPWPVEPSRALSIPALDVDDLAREPLDDEPNHTYAAGCPCCARPAEDW